ncbi:MAG TPA: hypothetical protein VNJ03_16975 [Vicinamibacterales bacterium]|nr:hypothetical protein [Vicinamibacterales bacterium]
MAGVKGRSGGHNRLSAREHELVGTYRADRHGPQATAAVLRHVPSIIGAELCGDFAGRPTFAATSADWAPATNDVEALGPRARVWLADVMRAYRFDPVEGQVLLAALRCLTRIEAIEAAIDAEGVTVEGKPHPLLAALRGEQRIFLAQWAALKLGRE